VLLKPHFDSPFSGFDHLSRDLNFLFIGRASRNLGRDERITITDHLLTQVHNCPILRATQPFQWLNLIFLQLEMNI
jgi:hypothetical protein